jgi:hypothetical protein
MPKELDNALSISNIDNTDIATKERGYILPRSAWHDQISYFRVLFKTKKALDIAEQKI